MYNEALQDQQISNTEGDVKLRLEYLQRKKMTSQQVTPSADQPVDTAADKVSKVSQAIDTLGPKPK